MGLISEAELELFHQWVIWVMLSLGWYTNTLWRLIPFSSHSISLWTFLLSISKFFVIFTLYFPLGTINLSLCKIKWHSTSSAWKNSSISVTCFWLDPSLVKVLFMFLLSYFQFWNRIWLSFLGWHAEFDWFTQPITQQLAGSIIYHPQLQTPLI